MRMMVVFEKGADLRFVGHLDLLRTIQRALRRSGLPIMYSQGFSPFVRLGFAAPLSVGIVGLREMMEVPMGDGATEQEFTEKMNAVLPRCLKIKACYEIDDHFPTLMSLVAGSRYTIAFLKGEAEDKAFAAVDSFMALKEYTAKRKTKTGEKETDIRPFVLKAETETKDDKYLIHLETVATAAGSLKPTLWLDSLCKFAGAEPFESLIYRDAILSRNKAGELVPMEELRHA